MKNTSITFKIVFLSAVLAAIFLGLIVGYLIYSARIDLRESAINTLTDEVVNEKKIVEKLTNNISETLIAISGTPPFQGMQRALDNDGFDEEDNSTLEQWKRRLKTIFTAEMKAVDLYFQIRFIDISGQEIVRVNRGSDNMIYSVTEEDLQYKGDRDYFIESINTSPGKVYISHTELNREGSPPRISEPHTPVIRYGIPVIDERTNEKTGTLIANVYVDELIDNSELRENATYSIYLVNNGGYFISHPDDTKEWGGPNDLDTGISFYTEFSNINKEDFTDEVGVIERDQEIYAYAKIYPDLRNSSRFWIVLENVPTSVLYADINRISRNIILFGLGAFLILFVVFLTVVRYLLSPLKKLKEGAEALGKGDFSKRIEVKSLDEIGRVTSTFNKMANELEDLYKSLDNKVKKKTKSLTKAVEDLDQEKKKMDAILSSMTEGLVAFNDKMEVVILNQAAAAMLRVASLEAVGKDIQKVVRIYKDGKHVKGMASPILNALDQGVYTVGVTDDYYVKDFDGRLVPISMSAAALIGSHDYEGIKGVVMFRDVTSEKKVDQAKTEFVSLASHQLRTPLSSINWYTEMLMNGDVGKVNPGQKDYLDQIYQSAQRMVDLVNSLLDVSRLELGTFSVEPVEIDIIGLAKQTVNDLKVQVKEKKLKLKVDFDETIGKIMADPKLLQIIYLNLLTNAIKYTQSGGEITFGVNRKEEDIEIKVEDNGYGIPDSQKDKIFTKLFRADNVQEKDTDGTGLGLYIIKSVVDHIGGKIWFESQENQGTTFYVNIPSEGMKQKEGSKNLRS